MPAWQIAYREATFGSVSVFTVQQCAPLTFPRWAPHALRSPGILYFPFFL